MSAIQSLPASPGHTRILVGGCFDVLHFGHIQFLEKAKKLGDMLIVALEADENVRRRKGLNRPIHTQSQRQHMLVALSMVDEVLLLPPMKTDEDYNKMVADVRPDIIAVTEGDLFLDKKQAQADKLHAQLIIIPKVTTPSTSQLAKLIGLE